MSLRHLAAVVLMPGLLFSCGGDEGTVEEPPLCTAGEQKCGDDGASVVQCNTDGSAWENIEQCFTGAVCDGQARCRCPGELVKGAESCREAGIEECADWITPAEEGCGVQPAACGAGEIFAGGECAAVGIAVCPDGFKLDPEGNGCLVDELPCTEEKEWFIKDGCLKPGPGMSCGTMQNPWPAETPAGEVIYVLSGSAEPEEEGSQKKPFKTIHKALEAASDGTTILVGAGSYPGGFQVDLPVRIIGKCPQYATIEGGDAFTPKDSEFPSRYAVFAKPGGTFEIAGFTLADSAAKPSERTAGIYVEDADSPLVHDLVFDGLSGAGVHFQHCASPTAHHLHVKNLTVLLGEVGAYGQTAYGVLVNGGEGATISDSLFEKTQGTDVAADGACPVISHSRFEGRGGLGGLAPLGIRVTGCKGGETEIVANRFSTKMTHALVVDGGQVLIARNIVSGTVTDYDDINGPAIKVTDATFSILDNWLTENQFSGIAVKGGQGDISGNRVDFGLPSDPGLKGGDGIVVSDCDPGPVVLSGNSLVENTRSGILVSGTIAKIENNLVKGTRESPSTVVTAGAGINVVAGSDAIVEGNALAFNALAGIRFNKAYGRATGNAVVDTAAPKAADGRCGGGIVVQESLLSEGITGNLISGNYCAGIHVQDSEVGWLMGNIIETSAGKDAAAGMGVVSIGSQMPVSGNWFRANGDAGMLYDASVGDIIGNVFEQNGAAGSGGGLIVQNVIKPTVVVTGNTFRANGFAGFVALASSLEFSRNVTVANVANKEGLAGAGVWIDEGCEAEVSFNRVLDNLLAGVIATGVTDVVVKSNFVNGTAKGSLPGVDAPVQMADGVAAASGAIASVHANKVTGCAMSGIAYLEAEGAAAGNELSDNAAYGLHLVSSQISEDPNLEPNHFAGNGKGSTSDKDDRVAPDYAVGLFTPCTQENL